MLPPIIIAFASNAAGLGDIENFLPWRGQRMRGSDPPLFMFKEKLGASALAPTRFIHYTTPLEFWSELFKFPLDKSLCFMV